MDDDEEDAKQEESKKKWSGENWCGEVNKTMMGGGTTSLLEDNRIHHDEEGLTTELNYGQRPIDIMFAHFPHFTLKFDYLPHWTPHVSDIDCEKIIKLQNKV
jgi:hypothetical protein